MSFMAYKATMFLIFFNYAMIISNFMAWAVFPCNDQSDSYVPGKCLTLNSNYIGTSVGTANIPILESKDSFLGDPTIITITTLMLTAGVLALFAFSLLIPTIPFVFLFLSLSGIITGVYIVDLPIDWVFKLPIIMGVLIVYYGGITQYAARSAFQGS